MSGVCSKCVLQILRNLCAKNVLQEYAATLLKTMPEKIFQFEKYACGKCAANCVPARCDKCVPQSCSKLCIRSMQHACAAILLQIVYQRNFAYERYTCCKCAATICGKLAANALRICINCVPGGGGAYILERVR